MMMTLRTSEVTDTSPCGDRGWQPQHAVPSLNRSYGRGVPAAATPRRSRDGWGGRAGSVERHRATDEARVARGAVAVDRPGGAALVGVHDEDRRRDAVDLGDVDQDAGIGRDAERAGTASSPDRRRDRP